MQRIYRCDDCGIIVTEYKKNLAHVIGIDFGVPLYTHKIHCYECEKLEKEERVNKYGNDRPI